MIYRTLFILMLLTVVSVRSGAQDFKTQYNDLVSKKDTTAQLELLKKWEAANSSDPEMFVAYFNYYVIQSRQDMIELGNDPKGEDVLEIMDTDTTVKEPVAYMYGNTSYNTEVLQKGLAYAEKGIEKNPARLDIRFGKTYMHGEVEDWKNFTDEIIKTVDYSAIIKNNWTWTDNKPLDDPKEFMLSSIQGYQLQLYNTNDDDLLENMKQISEAVLKHYPDHVESLSDLSIVYMIRKDYDKALEILLKAERYAPTDYIVLNNIAEAYNRKGDTLNAIAYLEKVIKNGDDEAKADAKKKIEELKKK